MSIVSVIIPTYNRNEMLQTALNSVCNQKFSDFELIVVDDGSEDGTREMLQGKYPGKCVNILMEHGGVSKARNAGIKIAKGEYIAFLDSDDYWKPEKLSEQIKIMMSAHRPMISHTNEVWYRNGKFLNQKKEHEKKEGNIFEQALRLCAIGMSTVMVRKKMFEEIGMFDESLPACEDYDLWLRATARYKVDVLPLPLTVKHGGHADQLSKRFEAMDRFRIKSIVKLLESGILTESQETLAREELARKCKIMSHGCKRRNKIEECVYYDDLILAYS